MPRSERITAAEKRSSSKHYPGIVSLAVTVLLCLPSLIAGAAFLINRLLYRNIEQWEPTSSALVALGVFLGSPLVALAAVVGGVTAVRRGVRQEFKYVQLMVVGVAAIATLSLLFRFAR
jgi:pheromone shutdown protein TraB